MYRKPDGVAVREVSKSQTLQAEHGCAFFSKENHHAFTLLFTVSKSSQNRIIYQLLFICLLCPFSGCMPPRLSRVLFQDDFQVLSSLFFFFFSPKHVLFFSDKHVSHHQAFPVPARINIAPDYCISFQREWCGTRSGHVMLIFSGIFLLQNFWSQIRQINRGGGCYR